MRLLAWRPRVIFFDLDDTLIYEDASDDAAILEVVRRLAPSLAASDATLIAAVRTTARTLWEQSGEIAYCRTIQTSAIEGLYGDYAGADPHLAALRQFIHATGYRQRVWTAALQTLGVDDPALGARLAVAFAERRWTHHVPFPDTHATVERLARQAHLGLITNGAPAIQRAKLAGSGVAEFFAPDLVVISGDLGVGKPDPAIFRVALARAGVSADAALMIGNSLRNDVVGAQNAGIRAIWVDRTGEPLPSNVHPERVVTTLGEIA